MKPTLLDRTHTGYTRWLYKRTIQYRDPGGHYTTSRAFWVSARHWERAIPREIEPLDQADRWPEDDEFLEGIGVQS